jgi:putative oxidoreductase
MSGTGTTSQTPSTTATRRRALNIALWAMQALLALMFAMAGLSKVFGDPAMVEMFATIGIGQWFRYVSGRWRSPVLQAYWSRGSPGLRRSGFSA